MEPSIMQNDSGIDVFDDSVGLRPSEWAARYQLQDEDVYDLDDREAITEADDNNYVSVVAKKEPMYLGPFIDFESATRALDEYFQSNQFNPKIRTKKKNREGQLRSITVQCDRAEGPAPVSNDRVRQSASKRCGCKVEVKLSQQESGVLLQYTNRMDNHTCEERDVVGHAANRRLTREHLDFIRDECRATSNVRPAVIMEKLRYQFPDHHLHINSIYNATVQIRAKSLNGRTPIQRLIDMIVEMPQYRFDVHYNSNGELLSFFFAHEDRVA